MSRQGTLLAFQLKDFIDSRPSGNEVTVTPDSARAIEFVTSNQARPAELGPPLTAAEPAGRGRSTSIEPAYIANWIIDRTKFRRDLRTLRNIVKPLLSPDSTPRPSARNSPSSTVSSAESESEEPETARRHSHTSGTTAEEGIYRQPFGPELPTPTSNMSGQPLDEATQRLVNAAADRAVESYIRRHPPQQGPPGPPGPQGAQGIAGAAAGGGGTPQWRPEELGFFDPHLPSSYGTGPMVRDGKDLYYRNVHLFCERIHDLAITKGEELVRANLNTCLRGTALIWYTAELSGLERSGIRNLPLDEGWINELKKRFKPNHSAAINSLVAERYTISDVRSGREPSGYVQQIVSHARDANFQDTQQQLTWAWKNLDAGLKRDIPTPNATTTLTEFLTSVEDRKEVWQEFYGSTRGGGRDDRGTDRRPTRQISKQNPRQGSNRQDGYQPFDGAYAPQYYPPSGYYPYQNQNAYYNNQRYQYRGLDRQSNDSRNQQQPRQSAAPTLQLPGTRQPLQITAGNASDSKSQSSQQKPNAGRGSQPRSGKSRAYVADEEDEAETEESFQHSPEPSRQEEYGGYHASNEDLDYYDMGGYPEDETPVNFTSPEIAKLSQAHCRWCRQAFQSNNALHQHIRDGCPRARRTGLAAKNSKPLPSAAGNSRPLPTADSQQQSTAESAAAGDIIPDTTSEVILSNTDSASDIGTGYGFRGWTYAKAEVTLSPTGQPETGCLDTGAGVTLSDRDFYKRQNPNGTIRTMATPLKVRGLGTHRHESSEYAICDIHLKGEKDGKPVTSVLRREVHLVDNLKANMLIGNDVIGSEGIVIDPVKKQAFITSTGATIPVEVRSPKNNIQRPVHIRKTTVIPPHTEVAVPINGTSLPETRDFLFEPADDVNFTLYAHLVDASTSAVIIRNDHAQPIQIPRNFRLGRISELDYPNAFQVSPEQAEEIKPLAAREPKSTHRDGWFKKLLAACATAYATATAVSAGSIPAADSSSTGLSTATLPASSAVNTAIPVISTGPPPSSASIPDLSGVPGLESSFGKKPVSTELVLPNGVTIHRSDAADSFAKIVEEFPAIWHDTGFADLPEENWMRIPLKSDWESKVTGKAKVYPLGAKDRALVDKTFDELHAAGKMSWTAGSTPFSYPVFCVWKPDAEGEQKGRPVIDIRGLNAITQPDAYPLPLQSEIIVAVRDCIYISVIDCSAFFYQWRVHPSDRHKLTVVSHRGQESFNVAVMGFKNSPAYVQRQIDRLLRLHRQYARAYVDDIVVFSKTKEEHETHLRAVFSVLRDNNISIKPTKAFIGYPSVSLLGQKVDSLGLATAVEKLRAIAKLRFPYNLRQLESYLGLTGWMRDYIPYYAGISKPLQERKTELLRHGPPAGNARRSYASKTRLEKPTELEKESFRTLQELLSKPSYLVHVDSRRQLFIDLDASKEFGFGAHLYYVKEDYLKDLQPGQFPPRHAIEPVLFLSRLLTSAETRYWPTELETAGIVWVLKKVRHIIEASADQSTPTVIYTDHGAALGIAKQTSLSTSSTDKLNLRLVRASDYIQRFNLDIRHKPGKQHIVPDALSRLASDNINAPDHDGELDALFTVSLVEMDPDFKQRILDGYKSDLNWQRISEQLDANEGSEVAAKLPFYRGEDGLIFRSDGFTTGDHAYEPRRLCIPHPVVKDILQLAHDEGGHPGYAKCFERLTSSWYIRGLSRYLRDYLKHCSKCQVFQTRRHAPYGSMQPILTPAVPFHTITIDFILALPTSIDGFDTIMSVSDKFTKRVQTVLGKKTWTAAQWGMALLDQLDIADWGLPKAIISDRDRKFLSDMWSAVFKKLGVKLLYSTAFHPQTDGQSERMNQLLEIALRYHMATMEDPTEWPRVLPRIQRHINNSVSATTGKSPNEAAYGFTPVQAADLWKSATAGEVSRQPLTGEAPFSAAARARVEVADSIAFAQMETKRHYDEKHKPMHMREGDYALIRLHKGYDIPSTAVLGPKYSQQYVGPFRILERVGRLAYRLDLPSHWRIHPVLSIAQLEPAPAPHTDPFQRPEPDHPESVFVEGDTPTVKSYEVERLIDRRQTKRRGLEYLVRWRGYGPEDDQWRNLPELGDAMELVKDYEDAMQKTVTLPGKLSTTDVGTGQKKTPGRPPKLPAAVSKPLTITAGTPPASSQKRKLGRPPKLPATVSKPLAITAGPPTSPDSSAATTVSAIPASTPITTPNTSSLVPAGQRLAVVIPPKQVPTGPKTPAVDRAPLALEWKPSTSDQPGSSRVDRTE